MNPAHLFTCLSHALRRYDDAVVLAKLVQLGALTSPYRASTRHFARKHLFMQLDYRQLQRASRRLEVAGIVRASVYPNTWTEYSVDPEKFIALLRAGMTISPILPSADPLPPPVVEILSRVAGSSPAGGAQSPSSPPEAAVSVSGPGTALARSLSFPGA
jgi:hypothetical protein